MIDQDPIKSKYNIDNCQRPKCNFDDWPRHNKAKV